ncbi:hypothetical protein CGCVW01_v012945 [Colletotrichum viniferum]|nr:hypothetical protein CGCVW01_v012945 [Colletotrichum viniferum]
MAQQGRDNTIWVDDGGRTYTWTNSRSCRKGYVGDGLNFAWRQAFYKGASSGPTHMGMGGTNLRTRIHFARIYGQSSVFGNLPLQDYVYLEHIKLAEDKHRFRMRVWKNIGEGSSKIVADGNKYCNMVGHRDGRANYVWTQSTGEMTLFTNRGKGTVGDTDAEGYWDPGPGIISRPPRSMDRRDLQLQDWDGDGDCSIIYINHETNAVEVFLSRYPQTGSRGWTHLTAPAPGLTCGTVSGYLQQDSGAFIDVGQIKFAIGKDRANLRWEDVNGDGKDDMLWMEKFSGDTWVWYNGGRGFPDTGGGSSFYWRVQEKKAYYGLAAGSCIYYADLDGNDHADEHYILESFNNKLRTSLNPPCGLTDWRGDDGPVTNPNLPVQSGCDEDDDTGGGSGDDHTPYVPSPKDDNPLPTCPDASKYTIIEKLEANAGLIDLWCGPQYTITILLQILQDSLARYDEIMASGYDWYFRVHADYLVSNAWSALRNFMLKHGDVLHLQDHRGYNLLQSSCYYRNFWFDAPQVEEFSTEDVTNPKTIPNKALGDAKPLIGQLSASLFEIQAISWEADPDNIVDSVSMSIILVRDSVDFTESVVEMGKELEEADKTSFILNLLYAIFLVVSMGGSTLASAGLTSLDRAFVVIGEGAGIGLGIYDMVQTPSAIPLSRPLRNSVQRQGVSAMSATPVRLP